MAEFLIAKDLNHPNIVKYKFLMKQNDTGKKKYECHMIIEFIDGKNLEEYIRYHGKAPAMEKV